MLKNNPQTQKGSRPLKSTNTNKKRKRAPRGISGVSVSNSMMPYAGAPAVSNSRRVAAQRLKVVGGAKVSKDGMSFLKCAFAAPDFATTQIAGVPDKYSGDTLVKQHLLQVPFVFLPSVDTYILLLPVPGYAYWQTTVATGTPILATTVFTGVPYSDNASMGFGSILTSADVVSRFRYVSNHMEIVNTTNNMSWTGSVQAWKMPIQMTFMNNSLALRQTITGLQGCNSTGTRQYTAPFNLGVYAGCYSAGCTFEWNSIVEGLSQIPESPLPTIDFGTLNPPGAFTGFDNGFQSMLFKVAGVQAPGNSCVIKTWACVEYEAVSNSALYEYQRTSPANDPIALELYERLIKELPVGVSYLDNDSFWQRVLNIVRRVSGLASAIPGPYGLAAGGVNSITTALDALYF